MAILITLEWVEEERKFRISSALSSVLISIQEIIKARYYIGYNSLNLQDKKI